MKNQVWSGDITILKLTMDLSIFAAIIDWHSKAIWSYKVSNSMDTTLVTDILEEALGKILLQSTLIAITEVKYTSH
ncbi:DDE-type integrase/transposase/recombinase [Candidatus Cardinium hertigii]|uniref:DDE-type integrase/transposase/recombinase n=1 Tax=Candidatus Cardinium hertigii TaxID=247481 RepID=UPI003D7F095B